jgi:copper resistance protein B
MRRVDPRAVLLIIAMACSRSLAAQQVDPAPAGHETMDHEQMDHSQHVAAGEPITPVPLLTDADRLAARPPASVHMHGGDSIQSYSLINRLEGWDAGPGTGLTWEAEGWIGGDINRLWWNTAGERVAGRTDSAAVELLFGHSFAPRWDWLVGARQDIRPREPRSAIAFGLQGLAPQWFEVSAMGYVGEGGRTSLRLGSEYTLLFTNRLMLQSIADIGLHGKDDASRGIGAGFSTAEFGLRLRLEFTRQFAPYVGLSWERAFGATAELRRGAGEAVHDTKLAAGLRIWF